MGREQAIQQQILARLGAVPGLLLWRNNTGAMRDHRGQLVRYGQPGSADVLGLAAPSGRFVALEVKAPGGKQSELQAAWQRAVEQRGGIYLLVTSVDEAVAGLVRCGIDC